MTQGFSIGQAIDLYKAGMQTGSFTTPSFAPSQPVNPTPPLIDTVKPSSMFPSPTSSPNNGSLGKPVGGLGTTPTSSPQPQNFGFNINQTGLGGVNNSVTSSPSSNINSVLNKPVGAPMV